MEMNYEFVTTVGRVILGIGFVVFGTMKIKAFGYIKGWLQSVGIPAPGFAVAAALATEVGGGLALIVDFYTNYVAITLAAFLVVVTFTLHKFWSAAEEQKQDQTTNFIKNAIIIGALLTMAI